MASKESGDESPGFEQGMQSLEGIVARLEQGNLPLEESLDAFEKGIHLLRMLHDKLGEVERRVEVLVRDADGVLRVRDGVDPAS
jgi:exodeoxyribonuclease VII small subunit